MTVGECSDLKVVSNVKRCVFIFFRKGLTDTQQQSSKRKILSRSWFNVGPRLRRWTNIKPTVVQCLTFAGYSCSALTGLLRLQSMVKQGRNGAQR